MRPHSPCTHQRPHSPCTHQFPVELAQQLRGRLLQLQHCCLARVLHQPLRHASMQANTQTRKQTHKHTYKQTHEHISTQGNTQANAHNASSQTHKQTMLIQLVFIHQASIHPFTSAPPSLLNLSLYLRLRNSALVSDAPPDSPAAPCTTTITDAPYKTTTTAT